ncbi:MAG: 2-dehydropantoate 2-reductase [Geminicoccaceae bacterium]|nr:2-dehydropantoate 2-reductase [Geminicoccaceae bacterium]
MRIAILGAGGVGGFLGARLAAAGVEVALLVRGAQLEAIRNDGLRLESARGDLSVRPRIATDDPSAIGPVDIVLCAVKLYDLETAGALLDPLIGPTTGVVTLQNGVDAPDVVAGQIGREHVLGGVAQIAAVLAAPGVVRTTGPMARFTVGELDGRRSERLAALGNALEAADVEHELTSDIRRAIWGKMVFLASFSGVTALIRLPIGPIREDPATRALLRAALAEAVSVAAAEGVDFGAAAVEDRLAAIDKLPAAMRSSLLDDLERGRRLETPWLSGTISRLGRHHGEPTPIHDLITTALKLHVDGRR